MLHAQSQCVAGSELSGASFDRQGCDHHRRQPRHRPRHRASPPPRAAFGSCVGYASNKAAADEVVAAIEAKNGKAIAVKCDVGEESDILATVQGRRRVRHARRARQQCRHRRRAASRVDEMSAERIQRMMAVNVTGSILCAREAVKRMSTQAWRQGRRHRQSVVGRGQARFAQYLCRLRGVQGRDRFLHRRARP